MTLWCFAIALRECRWREGWAAKLAPEIGSNSPKATMAILVLGHIVVTPVFGVSALGHKRTKRHVWSALPPKADIGQKEKDRFAAWRFLVTSRASYMPRLSRYPMARRWRAISLLRN